MIFLKKILLTTWIKKFSLKIICLKMIYLEFDEISFNEVKYRISRICPNFKHFWGHNYSNFKIPLIKMSLCLKFKVCISDRTGFFAFSQLTFTCSESTMETQKKVGNMLKVNNNIVQVFLLLTLNIFDTFFQCFYC